MFAMLLEAPGAALRPACVARPVPCDDEVLLRVLACGVCRTDLHILDGELADARFPLIPGHEIVGIVVQKGCRVNGFAIGQWVGVPWLGHTCGRCRYCLSGRENLCDGAKFTGYTLNGGYAEYVVASQHFCFDLPDSYSDVHAAPLLCAGLIGYRALAACGDARRIGIYGFGAAAHIISQLASWQGRKVYAFTRAGDVRTQEFALRLGAVWAADVSMRPPDELDAAILFAPAGELVPIALGHTARGGVVVCAGIHMSDIPSFSYSLLWGERRIGSIANLTRRDGEEFLKIAPRAGIKTEVEVFSLNEACEALFRLRQGKIRGAAVLVPVEKLP